MNDIRVSSIQCFDQCRHVELSSALKEIAVEQEQALARQKGMGNPSTKPLNARRDYLGSLAQNCILDYFQSRGMDGGLEMTPYFDPMRSKDEFDFRYRGSTYDVKSKPVGKFKSVNGRTTYLVSNHQKNKRVDNYCFISIDTEEDLAHIAGVISFDEFWDKSTEPHGDWVKSPCHMIEAKYLRGIEEIV